MNAPDTIYIDGKEPTMVGGYLAQRAADTDLAYVSAATSYELAKTVEAQNAEIGLLKAENESLAESNLCIRRYEAEIARLREALREHGGHSLICESLEHGYQPCTCGFTAALKGE